MIQVSNGRLVLEPSTNTHVMDGVVEATSIDASTMLVKTEGVSRVLHGEHGTLGFENKVVVKYVQKELNPITKQMQNAFD